VLSLSSACVCATAVPDQPSVTVNSTAATTNSVFSATEAPVVTVDSTAATTISLSWTSAGESNYVLWTRDTSGECPDEDEGYNITASTSYNITGLEEDSNYTIIVLVVNAIEIAISGPVTAVTTEAGERLT